MALVKLPASSLAALMGERELGTACGLGSPLLFFFLIQFGIRKLDSGKWSCALYPTHPRSGPLFSIVLHPQAPLYRLGTSPFPACVSSQTPVGVVRRGGGEGTRSLLRHLGRPCPHGLYPFLWALSLTHLLKINLFVCPGVQKQTAGRWDQPGPRKKMNRVGCEAKALEAMPLKNSRPAEKGHLQTVEERNVMQT